MRLQAQEELMHGMKFYDYMIVSGGRILLTPVEGPATSWDSPLAAFEAALAHERLMTRRCNDLASLAIAEKDHATNNLVQWFVTEQVEEESNVENIVQKLKLLGRDGPGLFMMDRELKARAVAPAAGGGAGLRWREFSVRRVAAGRFLPTLRVDPAPRPVPRRPRPRTGDVSHEHPAFLRAADDGRSARPGRPAARDAGRAAAGGDGRRAGRDRLLLRPARPRAARRAGLARGATAARSRWW